MNTTSTGRPPRPGLSWMVAAALMLAVSALSALPVGAQAPEGSGSSAPIGDPVDDPNLEQRIDADQRVATGRTELAAGHVDMGPRFLDGVWRLLIHDDAADPSVWRDPAEVLLRVGDAGKRPAPVDPAYGFLGAEAGRDVWVISQTEIPDVVWLGWNTQDPEVMDRVDRGVTLSLLGADGPGQVSLYLQSGTFGAPDVLWRSVDSEPAEIWVDTNTHTHANWVFTEPGVYLIRVAATAELGGEPVSATADLRVAVGDAARAEDAFAANWAGAPPVLDESGSAPAGAGGSGSTDPSSSDEEASPGASSAWLIVVMGVGFGIVVAVAVVLRRRAGAARRAGLSSE